MELPEDRGLGVKFERRQVYNEVKSKGAVYRDNDGKIVEEVKGAGRPIFDDKDYVVIVIPGDKDSIIEREALFCGAEDGTCTAPRQSECDVHRFPRHWAAYKKGQGETQSGTDLLQVVTRAQKEELAYFRVYSVEQLAAMSDSNAGPFLPLREQARTYLQAQKDASNAQQLRDELAKRDAQMKQLEEQVAQLLAAQTAKPAPKQAAKGS